MTNDTKLTDDQETEYLMQISKLQQENHRLVKDMEWLCFEASLLTHSAYPFVLKAVSPKQYEQRLAKQFEDPKQLNAIGHSALGSCKDVTASIMWNAMEHIGAARSPTYLALNAKDKLELFKEKYLTSGGILNAAVREKYPHGGFINAPMGTNLEIPRPDPDIDSTSSISSKIKTMFGNTGKRG